MLQLILTLFLSGFSLLHDFHVTHTTLHFNSNRSAIEITVKLAVEDLERALEEQGVEDLRIGTKYEHKQADSLIKTYMKTRLTVSPNSKEQSYLWVGKELSRDLHDLYIYCEIRDYKQYGEIKTLEIGNSLLTEVLPDQVNIVSVQFADLTKRLTFTRSNARHIMVIR